MCWLATASWRPFSSTSRKSRAFWMASADWVRERLQELDDLGGELPGRSPVHRERADDLVLPHERHRQQRPVAHPEQDVAKMALVGALLDDVGHLHRLPPLGGAPHEALAHPESAWPG